MVAAPRTTRVNVQRSTAALPSGHGVSLWGQLLNADRAKLCPRTPARFLGGPPRGNTMSEILWSLAKTDAEAHARARTTAYGTELRIVVAGELVWSRTFLGDTATAITNAAAGKRQELVEEGWTPK